MSSAQNGGSTPKGRGPSTMRLEERPSLRQEVARALREPFRPCLVVISGSEVGLRVRVGGEFLLGRDPDAAFCLTDPGVSWHHARLEDRGDAWAVLDLGSTNGVFVNGDRITEVVLHPNDKIKVGTTVLRFEIQDATEQEYDDLVQRLLHLDDLSGLYVRRRFDAELGPMLERAAAVNEPLGMLVMDLDGIKAINDANGHLFGAYVIGEAGQVIARVIGNHGIAARFGGDEYVAAVQGLDIDATAQLGERIREAIANHVFEHNGKRLYPGISIGVAAYPQSGKDATLLFQSADDALYRAKRGGKNRVST